MFIAESDGKTFCNSDYLTQVYVQQITVSPDTWDVKAVFNPNTGQPQVNFTLRAGFTTEDDAIDALQDIVSALGAID